ncbi:T9SS type A sorting domain-containing protein [Hymenobacter sp. BT683]|uniref:T9SS type A sorting domain-containing protein n=1 Tax=Hymenobacter jeongseonensis TaxID=2791027 RepID=A0ABS0INB5_9BACT|nr:T9SS type A sorting domain-containing protein [Hymenobacter jeongseonensis]MBF9239866.1 T9SS type A sorting domain-containing protein [Hymenobacter jeongseonensis]
MKKLVLSWALLITLALAAAVPAWAAPGVVSLTTPVLPANAARTAINSLTVSSGTPTRYNINSLPGGGTLYVNNTAVTAARSLTPTEATQLFFQPSGTAGTYSYTFTATDGTGTSAAATYAITVGQAACGQGFGFDFSTRNTGEGWTANTNVPATNVTISTSGYSTSPGPNSLQIGDGGGTLGKSLTWNTDYTSISGMESTVTFTFSRALTGFTIVVQDIDTGRNSGNAAVVDQVQFDGYLNNAATTPIALTAADVKVSNTNSFSGGANCITGYAASAAAPSGNVTVTFPQAITKLTLTYRNLVTNKGPFAQIIGIPSFGWCSEADIQTVLTGPVRAQAGSTVTLSATTTNNGPDPAASIAPKVQLPTGLFNVTGGTYVSSTGVLTLPVISNLASGASVGQAIGYTMPNSVAVSATSSFTSTANDPVAGNNTSTITTSQNRVPVASNVTHAPAILSSTSTQTALLAFNANDPDATTGNTTIKSFTILSLPTAAQGTLYVNGTAATLNQVIAVPTTATASNPGYQLSFVPNGAFAGSASFTYKATDDTNISSNTATYTVPVTAGADLMSTVNGSTSGVEGQAKTNSVTTINNGPAAATNVVPTITLSHRPPFSTVSVTNGSYDPTTGVVTFNTIASLASGASSFNTVTLLIHAAPESFTLTGASTSTTADPTPANNNGSAPAATLAVTVAPIGPAGLASACATPGNDGSPTITTNPNTYYPAANQTVAQGATSFTVGAATGTTLTPIVAGDLLLIMQMQGAEVDATNTDSYGDGVAGGFASNTLNNANFTAGRYEYAVAASAVAVGGGTVTVSTGLKYSYDNASATSVVGQRRFQVVRIPQYQNLTVSGTVAPKAWDGSTGGVLALDVTGQLTFASGASLDASGKGFRGGAGQKLTGTAGLSGTDYRTAAPASASTTVGAHAMKGEGTAGTPRYVNTGTDLLDTGVDGYPNGSAGRGAPGNAGGGGTDGNPGPAGTGNTQNSGGGGGGNASRGGRGGNAWSTGAAVGGETGGGFNPPSSSRLIMGGGGGAGTNNDGTGGGMNPGYASSGAAGGGIVLVRTGSVAGVGTVLANGAAASSAVVQDGGGGGGAGGSVLMTVNNTATLSRLTLVANGGNGGSNSASSAHGPGGGGSGGMVLANATPASASVASGASGTTTGGSAYGASAGGAGITNTQISNSIAGSTAGANCAIDVTASLLAPAAAASGQTVNLSVTFANNGGVEAAAVSRIVTLSSGSSSNPFTAVSAPGGTISGLNTDVVTITYPAVAPLVAGASSSFNLSYTAPGTAGITSTAAIAITTATTPEAVTDNNSRTVVTAITGFADVVSVVFGLNSSITDLPTGTYAVVFANNGPASATVTARNVQLPAGATLTTAQLNAITAQGGSYSAGVISFGPATLSSRQAQTFNFSYRAPLSGGANTLVSTIATTSQQDVGNGTGIAPDVFSFAVTNNPASDLATDGVTVSSASVATGQPASFVVKYTNFGPSVATGGLRFAQLTPGLTGVVVTDYDATVLSGAYNATTGIVILPNVATLASGGTAYVTIAFTAPAIGPVSVSGSMSGGTGSISSGIYGNNQAVASIDVVPVADVGTAISGPTDAISGNLTTFAVTTRNNGPSPAADVVQTVQLPTGLSGVFATRGGTYDAGTGMVTFPARAVLASGALVTNTVSFPLAATFTAVAAVNTTTTEASGTTANNSATAAPTTASAPTTDQANVYTMLASSAKNVSPNAPVTFTIGTSNAGPASALAVVQQLTLRPGLSIQPTDISNGGTYDATTGVVTFPALASLASGTTITNTVVIAAPAAGPLGETASVTSATSDPVPGDNRVVRYVDVFAVADVATTLVGPSIASATQAPTTFIVNLLNNGPVPARAVVQTVAIPAGLAPADVVVFNSGTYDPATGLIAWPAVPTLAAGEGRTYTYSYVAPAYASTDAANPRTVVSLAAVTSATTDDVPANNTASVATLIRWNADVAIAVAGPTTAVVGNTITFAVATTNNGPAPAPSVTPTVRIATGLTNVVASGGGTYDATSGLITFPTLTNLVVGATGTVTNTISLTVPDRPIIGVSAAANVPTATNDTNLTNNAATLTLPVMPQTTAQVDVQTTIASNVSSQQAGQPIVLTVTATNSSANGNTTASGIRQRVGLPAGLSGVVAADVSSGTVVPVAGAYDALSGTVTFPIVSNVAAGNTLTYTITVSNYSTDPLVAKATVNGNFSDPLPANNIQVVSVTIVPVADVATRVSGPATVLPGSRAVYEVVTLNNGPSPAGAVAQTVQLPTGLNDVLVSGGGIYNATDGLITFHTIAVQAVGLAGQVTNTFTFTFPTTASALMGTVTTGTTQPAGSLANNTSALATALANEQPLANALANRLQSPEGNTATALTITALVGYDADGSIGSFTVTTLPAAADGVLLLRGTAVAVNQPISLADAANLTFDPSASFVGTAFFSFTATDNQGAVSLPATYGIAVGQDNAAVYVTTPVKGGNSNPYQDGDVIANVFDANGGAYSAAAAVADGGVRNASVTSGSTLPDGLMLDPTTGQVRVLDRKLLVADTYPVIITTVDANGGVTTQTVPLRIGDNPLPVELIRFEAKAVGADAHLSWTTAQELNNQGFRVQRSLDGVSFVQLDVVAGAGTTTQQQHYTYTEAGVGRQHPGTVYYRLQQVDVSGKATYSPVRAVVYAPEALSLFPNPAYTYTTLNLGSLPAITFDVTLVDMTGRVVQTHALAGGKAHELQVSGLPNGAYAVIVRGGGLKLLSRLLKQ